MSTTVSKIMKLPIFVENSELLAGAAGLGNEVLQATVMEVPDFHANTASKQTFILTTLFAHHDSIESINRVIESLCKRKVAAIAIKLGRFLDKLDASTVEIAEKYDTPLFAFTNQVLFRDLLGDILTEIVDDQRAIISGINQLNSQLIDDILSNQDVDGILKHLVGRVSCYCCCASLTGEILGEGTSLAETVEMEQIHREIEAISLIDMQYSKDYGVVDDYYLFPCSVHKQTPGCLIVRFASGPNERDILFVKQVVSFVSIKMLERLLKIETERRMVASVLDEILFGQHNSEQVVKDRLKLLGFVPRERHLIMLVTSRDDSDVIAKTLFLEKHFSYLKHQFNNAFVNVNEYLKGSDIVIMFSFIKDTRYVNSDILRERVLALLDEGAPRLSNSVYLGYGLIIDDLRQIPTCYDQARKAIEYGKMFSPDQSVFSYYDYVDIGLLSHSLSSSDSKTIFRQIVHPIEEYDRRNNSNLWKTLEVCLFADSLNMAAKDMFIHISTLRYRLQKIHSLTDADFFSSKGRLMLQFAYLLSKLREDEPF